MPSFIKYLGKQEELTLVPPVVSKKVVFNKKNDFVESIKKEDGEKLVSENPFTFEWFIEARFALRTCERYLPR